MTKQVKRNPLVDKLRKDKKLLDLMYVESVDEHLSLNSGIINLLFSGKITGGIKKGKISTIAADSSWGKSLIGLNALVSAYKSGMTCVVIDSENAFNKELATDLGVDVDDILIYETSIIPEIKKIFARINAEFKNKRERKEVFFLIDSWGTIVETQVLDKAEEGSSAVNMQSAKFKNELANIINAYGNTTLVVNHVYDNIGVMFGEKYVIPGGKRLRFNSDSIVLCSSASKAKDKNGNIFGKIITATINKSRSAKEFQKAKFLIEHNGGINPFFGLLEDSVESGVVIKTKNAHFARVDHDIDKETGEVLTHWHERDLYCAKFWIPLYKSKKFNEFLESKYAYFETELTAVSDNIMDLLEVDESELSSVSCYHTKKKPSENNSIIDEEEDEE